MPKDFSNTCQPDPIPNQVGLTGDRELGKPRELREPHKESTDIAVDALQQIRTARVEKLVSGGAGLLRDPKLGVCFLEQVLPGELVRYRIAERNPTGENIVEPDPEEPTTNLPSLGKTRLDTQKKTTRNKGVPSFQHAELIEVLESAPQRVKPCCEYYGECGGCDWQHINHAAQLDFKAAIVRENLTRLGGLKHFRKPGDIGRQLGDEDKQACAEMRPPISDALASPLICRSDEDPIEFRHPGSSVAGENVPGLGGTGWGYRQRAKFVTAENGLPGFRKKSGKELIAVPHCQILQPAILTAVYHSEQNTAPGQELHVFSCGKMCYFQDQEFVYHCGDLVLHSEPQVFFQSNARILPLLLKELRRDLGPLLADWSGAFFDLYAGVGLFSLYFDALLHPKAPRFAVERSPEAHKYLRKNLAQTDFQCYRQDVGAFLRTVLQEKNRHAARNKESRGGIEGNTDGLRQGPCLPNKSSAMAGSFVFVDPARSGLSAATSRFLQDSGATYICYLSCDAASFSRDMGRLQGVYRMEFWRLVDFYPQTHHIEVLALLQSRHSVSAR